RAPPARRLTSASPSGCSFRCGPTRRRSSPRRERIRPVRYLSVLLTVPLLAGCGTKTDTTTVTVTQTRTETTTVTQTATATPLLLMPDVDGGSRLQARRDRPRGE